MTRIPEWLSKLSNIRDVQEACVTIRGTTYDGVSYRDDNHGDGERLLLIGELPSCYRRSARTTFRFEGDERDWYVACYWNLEAAAHAGRPLVNEYHPSGATFMLCPWQIPSGEAIDCWDERPYARVPAKRNAAPDART